MSHHQYTDKITCAYLYPITRYGYPPDIRHTAAHIAEMAAMGFRSIELEGIGEENIRYLYQHHAAIAEKLGEYHCEVPVLCVVLPQLSSADPAKQSKALELFEMGCITAKALGAAAVLDNGPLLPLEYPAGAPIRRHYTEEHLLTMQLPAGFSWNDYWEQLTATYNKACSIAGRYNLTYQLHPCEGSLVTGTDSYINFSTAVNSHHLRFNLDTANQFYFKDNLPLSLVRLADKIDYIHISDNRGQRVEHLAPGNGKIHWDSFFSTLRDIRFKGKFAIDVGGAETGITDLKEAFLQSADWLNEQLERYSLN